MLIIHKEGTHLVVRECDNFFARSYRFGTTRVFTIWKKSGKPLAVFARENKLNKEEVKRWLGGTNPTPEARLKLAFIEAKQRETTKKKKESPASLDLELVKVAH